MGILDIVLFGVDDGDVREVFTVTESGWICWKWSESSPKYDRSVNSVLLYWWSRQETDDRGKIVNSITVNNCRIGRFHSLLLFLSNSFIHSRRVTINLREEVYLCLWWSRGQDIFNDMLCSMYQSISVISWPVASVGTGRGTHSWRSTHCLRLGWMVNTLVLREII